MPGKSRSQKRKSQYEELIAQLNSKAGSIELKNAVEKLGKLWDDISTYMDPDNTVEIDRKKLQSFLNQYVKIADSLTELPDAESEEMQKLRKIMGKDIRIINSALNQKTKDTFNLREIFDNSRSIMVKVDDKALETKGGAVNSRMHIKNDDDNIDGYFTVHNEPYSFKQNITNIAKTVAGDDKDCLGFVKYLLSTEIIKKRYPSSFMNTFMPEAKAHAEWNLGLKIKSDVAKSKFPSNEEYRKHYYNAISTDITNYVRAKRIRENDPRYNKLVSFAKSLTTGKGLDSLIDAGGKVFLEVNHESILNGNGINKNSRIDKRNSAMSAVAEMIGTEYIIAHSNNMRVQVGAKELKGTFMKKANGLDPRNIKDLEILKKATPKSFENPGFIRDLANLQILDYICGNTDRHFNNMVFQVENVKENGKDVLKIVGVQGIDNDTSLGSADLRKKPTFMSRVDLKDIKLIPRTTAESIMRLKPEMLRTVLAGYDLNDREISMAVNRLQEVKDAINIAWATKTYEAKDEIKNMPRTATLKIMDEEDFGNITIDKHLFDDKGYIARSKDPDNTTKATENFNLYTRVELFTMAGDFHSNMMDEYYAGMVKHMSGARDFEKEAKIAFDYLLPAEEGDKRKDVKRAPKKQVNANKNTDEYKEMISALKELKSSIEKGSTYLNPWKLQALNLDYADMKKNASEAVFKTTSYYSLVQDKINKKKQEGKTVTKEEEEHAQQVRDIVDNLEELYGEYNKFLSLSQSFETIKKEKKLVSADNQDEHTRLTNAESKPQVADSFEKIERMIQTDKVMCQENMEAIRRGEDDSSYLGQVCIGNMMEINARENYIKLIKGNLSPEEKRNAMEEIAISEEIRHYFLKEEKLSREFINTPGMMEEFKSNLLDYKRKDPRWEQSLEHIEKKVEMLKNPKTPLEIKSFNMTMKNGGGTKDEELSFYQKFIKFTSMDEKTINDLIVDARNNAAQRQNEAVKVKSQAPAL